MRVLTKYPERYLQSTLRVLALGYEGTYKGMGLSGSGDLR